MYKRSHPNSQFSVQEGTADVSKDGYFYILNGTEIVGRHRTVKKATDAYLALLEQEGVSREVKKELTKEESDRLLHGDFYIYGKFNEKKGNKTRTYG